MDESADSISENKQHLKSESVEGRQCCSAAFIREGRVEQLRLSCWTLHYRVGVARKICVLDTSVFFLYISLPSSLSLSLSHKLVLSFVFSACRRFVVV